MKRSGDSNRIRAKYVSAENKVHAASSAAANAAAAVQERGERVSRVVDKTATLAEAAKAIYFDTIQQLVHETTTWNGNWKRKRGFVSFLNDVQEQAVDAVEKAMEIKVGTDVAQRSRQRVYDNKGIADRKIEEAKNQLKAFLLVINGAGELISSKKKEKEKRLKALNSYVSTYKELKEKLERKEAELLGRNPRQVPLALEGSPPEVLLTQYRDSLTRPSQLIDLRTTINSLMVDVFHENPEHSESIETAASGGVDDDGEREIDDAKKAHYDIRTKPTPQEERQALLQSPSKSKQKSSPTGLKPYKKSKRGCCGCFATLFSRERSHDVANVPSLAGLRSTSGEDYRTFRS